MRTTTNVDPALLQELVNLLIPYMSTEPERQARLRLALPNNAYRQINFQGAADIFTANMVNTLLKYGEDDQGKQTIIALLDVLHTQVGPNNQYKIAQVRQRLQVHFQQAGWAACPRCGTSNRTTAQFCRACGQRFTRKSLSRRLLYTVTLPVYRQLATHFFRNASALLFLVMVIAFAWWFMQYNNKLTTPPDGTASTVTTLPPVLDTATPTPTITPTSDAAPRSPTTPPMATPLPTIAPISTTAFTPVTLPTPTAIRLTDCSMPTALAFRPFWRQATMGCALSQAQTVWASWTPFERGYMLWRRDTDRIYIFYDNSQWQSQPDEWVDGMEPPSRGAPPAGLQAPIRGTGWVWANDEAIFLGLGWATDKQKGFCADVQPFEQGFLLQSSTVEFCHEEHLYNFAREATFGVLALQVHNTGYWQR